jgi:tetratricopeptide (TPR) repeat protein
MPQSPEIISLLGAVLYAEPPAAERPKLEAEFVAALTAFEAAPDDEEALILYGRRMAYLWRYQESIAIYTNGLRAFPQSAMLYRHRGHRYISVRRFEAAERDMARANELLGGDFNILYHLGLARWLLGDFAGALAPYKECLEVAGSDEHRVAIAYWLYLTLLRLGRIEEAAAHLGSFSAKEEGENVHYFNVLRMWKGEQSEQDVLALMDSSDYNLATMSYGLGVWHLIEGRRDQARSYFESILSSSYWSAFGFIASEVEMLREGMW